MRDAAPPLPPPGPNPSPGGTAPPSLHPQVVISQNMLPFDPKERARYGASWPHVDFGAADLIVSFGADFLDGWGLPVPQQLAFAEARGKVEGAPRFIYVGARRSLTGLNADQWIPAKPGAELAIVNAIAGKATAARVFVRQLNRPEALISNVTVFLRAFRIFIITFRLLLILIFILPIHITRILFYITT